MSAIIFVPVKAGEQTAGNGPNNTTDGLGLADGSIHMSYYSHGLNALT